jgi:hypothetical protein
MMDEPTLFDTPPGRDTMSRADQIKARFVAFHRANPDVWRLFERFAFEMKRSGRPYYSAHAVVHRIVWETDIETTDESVKVNNDFAPYYSRMFRAVHPFHADFFRVRRRFSQDKPAYESDIASFESGRPGDEAALYEELAALAREVE